MTAYLRRTKRQSESARKPAGQRYAEYLLIKLSQIDVYSHSLT
jgi:hypothetical protein